MSAAVLPYETANAAQESSIEARLNTFFRDKSEPDLDRLMNHFSRSTVTYIDAAVGSGVYDWQQRRDTFARWMAMWPEGSRSYPIRIIGDENSAIVFFRNTPGMFGPSEIRAVGVVDYRNGKIVRWIDYWDGRHFGLSEFLPRRTPDDRFPTDFRESLIGQAASPVVARVATGLTDALRAKDFSAATGYFAEDAVLADLPAHIQVVGLRSIGTFFAAAHTSLPYVGPGTRIRHIVSGGYEWIGPSPVPLGVTALELDDRGKIVRMTSMWDGSRVSADVLLSLAAAAVET